MNEQKINFPVYSALFHVVDNLILTRGNLSYKIDRIIGDTNDINLEIRNEERLKNKLFKEIVKNYNSRIDRYKLLLNKISPSDINKFEITNYKLVSNSLLDSSGNYGVYPRTFFCKRCGDMRSFTNNKEWEKFNPKKCRNSRCSGEYQQVPLIRFCEQCGKVEPLNYYCKEHGTEHWKLIRPDKNVPSTWKVVCTECQKKGVKPMDILRYQCNHSIYGEQICAESSTRFRPLVAIEGSVLNSVVITVVDVPKLKYNALLQYLDYILLGLYLKRFDSIFQKISPDGKIDLEKIDLYLKLKNDPNLKDLIDGGIVNPNLIDIVEELLYEIKALKFEFMDFALENINDYLILSGVFSNDPYNVTHFDKYIQSINESSKKETFEKNYDILKNEFKIENISYVSDIRLIASSIGVILGINKFSENNFVPHFQPLWKNKNKDSFRAYSYPFETEGLIFDLDKIMVVNWLIKNKILHKDLVETEEEAIEVLFQIKENTPEYDELKTLLHTLAHVLIRRSSLYTGLDSDSCGELLFVNTASFLIYSSSNINIGGFSFVFENSIFDWFRDVKLEVKDCVLDPTCIHETGSCFSCLHLPEYVCSEFNQLLDRDVLIGKKRYNQGFWE